MNNLVKIVLIMISIVFFSRCESTKNPIQTIYVEKFTVTPDSARIKPGENVTLNAYLQDLIPDKENKGLPDKNVIWQLISGLGTISNTIGYSTTYTAPIITDFDSIEIAILAFPQADMREKNQKVSIIRIYNPNPPKIDTSVCFNRDILPIFNSNCAMSTCHDSKTKKEGFDMSSYKSILRGIKPGKPNSSKIYTSLSSKGEEKMPPTPRSALTIEQMALIKRWILEGATNDSCVDNSQKGCDSVNVTYSKSISKIILLNCLGCHSTSKPQGNVNLDNYSSIKSLVDKGSFLGCLTGDPKYKPMPGNNLKLNQCSLIQIKRWIGMGAPNN